jgi:MFS family permease
MSRLNPLETQSIISLASLYIVRMLGLFMVLPVLALSGSDYQGSNVFLLGIALGIYGLTQAILQIPFGMLSDRFGRKPLIALGLFLFGMGSLVAASADSVQGLIVGRALQGAGAIAGVLMAMVADLTSEENRTKAMASIGASIGVAFALSLVIGPLITGLGGIRWVFWFALILSIAGIIILLKAVPDSPQSLQKPGPSSDEGNEAVLLNIHLWRLNIGIFTLHGILMALFVCLPLLLVSVDIAQIHHSWIYLGVMLFSFILMIPLMIIGERQQRVKPIFLSLLMLGAMALVALSSFAQSQLGVVIAMLFFFVAFNYLEATLPSLMSKTVLATKRGTGSALFSTCQFLGAALGGIVGGWLMSHYDAQTLLLVCAGALVFWWLIALGMVIPQHVKITTENVIA